MNEKQKIRFAFREKVFARDGHKCRICQKKQSPDCQLDAHHIKDRNDIENGGYVKENGISLCPICHIKAELFHISGGKDHAPGYHPDDLYKKIASSKEKAIEASKKLKII